MIEMAQAKSLEEREAVYRFWYSVYVAEMGRYREVADHERGVLRGVEDDRSYIFYAADDGVVVGACRFSWGKDGFTDRQLDQYSLGPFLDELPAEWICVGERTMVAASHRGGTVWVDLTNSTTPFIESLGIHLSFGASEPHLIMLYAQFGQRPYSAKHYVSEESGYIVPTLALPHGLQPFGEPLPSCLSRAIAPDPSVRNALFDGSSFDSGIVALWRRIAPAMLTGLSDAELGSVCKRATLLTLEPGVQFLRRGGTARTPYLVVAGRVQVRDDGNDRELGPGALFGEAGWLHDDSRSADVYVDGNGAQVLALNERVMRSLAEVDASAASTLTGNVAAVVGTA